MIRKSKLPAAISPCVRIFEFLGFADYRSGRWWIVVKLLVMNALLLGIAADVLLDTIGGLSDSNGVLIHIVNYLLTAMQGFICLNFSILNSSDSLKFIERMVEVDELLLNALFIDTNYDDLRWTLITRTGGSLSFLFVSTGVVLGSVLWSTPNLIMVSSAFFISIKLGQIYALRFVFMVQLLTFYLNLMASALEKSISNQPLLVRSDERQAWKCHMESNHSKLRVLRQTYRQLWDASCLINRWSGAGLAYVFFVQTMFLIYQGYRMCIDISSGKNNFRHHLVILQTALSMFSTHYYSQMCLNAVSQSACCCFWLISFLHRRGR